MAGKLISGLKKVMILAILIEIFGSRIASATGFDFWEWENQMENKFFAYLEEATGYEEEPAE